MDVTASSPKPVDPNALDPYRRWARFLFALLATVAGIGLVLLIASGSLEAERLASSWPLVTLLGLNVAVTVVVLVSLMRGVTAGLPWAIHAVAPVCHVLVAFGLLRSVLAIGRGEFLIPLEALGALLVLSRPHDRTLLPSATEDDRRRVSLVTGLMVLTYFVPLLLPAVIG